jgi:NTE family protein
MFRVFSMFKFVVVGAAAFSLLSCQTTKSKKDLETSTRSSTLGTSPESPGVESSTNERGGQEATSPSDRPEGKDPDQMTMPPQVVDNIPKIGLILGPGGAKAFAHIAVLHEFEREKIPIYAIAGLEFGAPMAALYAWKGFANDVEWQMMKLKTERLEKRWIDPQSTFDFLDLAFQKSKVENLKLPFACVAHNLAKSQLYVMSRGPLRQLLPYCWPYPPLMKPYSSNISGVRDPKLLADYLRSQGANVIVYVNVLSGKQHGSIVGDKESLENIIWQEIATSLTKNPQGIDHIIQLNLEGFSLLAFERKREILQKGAELGSLAVKTLAHKLNL